MLHAKDLMIGDYLGCDASHWVKVTAIAEDGIYFEDEISGGACSFDHLFSLPLTPEILEKNEFERTSDGWECNESDVLTIAIYDGNSCDIWIAEAPFDCKHLTYVLPFTRSVHELQHCLKLVGIEKTIEL